MTEGNIPVPAESIRQLAISATDEVVRKRNDGRKASAKRIEESIGEAFNKIDGKDGEFVSLNRHTVSCLAAAGCVGAMDHADAAEAFLVKYNIWDGE